MSFSGTPICHCPEAAPPGILLFLEGGATHCVALCVRPSSQEFPFSCANVSQAPAAAPLLCRGPRSWSPETVRPGRRLGGDPRWTRGLRGRKEGAGGSQ